MQRDEDEGARKKGKKSKAAGRTKEGEQGRRASLVGGWVIGRGGDEVVGRRELRSMQEFTSSFIQTIAAEINQLNFTILCLGLLYTVNIGQVLPIS